MKIFNKLLIVLIAFLFCNKIISQEVSVKTGYGVANFYSKSDVSTDFRNSYLFGFGYKHQIKGKSSIGADLIYLKRGSLLTQETQLLKNETEINLNYLQITPKYCYKLLKNLEINPGLSIDIFINGSYLENYEYDGGTGSRSGDIDYKTLGMSLTLEINYTISINNNLLLKPGLIISQGVTDVNKVNSPYKYKNQNFHFSIALTKRFNHE